MAATVAESGKSAVGPVLRFVLGFGLGYLVLNWFLSGSGPAPFLNDAIDGLTRIQTAAAERILRFFGEDVTRTGDVLRGPSFSCAVGDGCSGMSAITLVIAGLLSFPAPVRRKVLGFVVLVPAVLIVNILRIAGLFWTGVHAPAVFNLAHVYIGQVVVIVVTLALWWLWISWSSRPRAASSSLS